MLLQQLPKSVLNWTWARLNEGSTWAGLGIFASAVSMALQSNASLSVAVVSGVLAVILKDKGNS